MIGQTSPFLGARVRFLPRRLPTRSPKCARGGALGQHGVRRPRARVREVAEFVLRAQGAVCSVARAGTAGVRMRESHRTAVRDHPPHRRGRDQLLVFAP